MFVVIIFFFSWNKCVVRFKVIYICLNEFEIVLFKILFFEMNIYLNFGVGCLVILVDKFNDFFGFKYVFCM